MSMPQSGPPDPNTPGPVSGSPQSPAAPQGPPPNQMAPPPPPPPTGQRPPSRPGALAGGGIAVGALGLLFLIMGIMPLLGIAEVLPPEYTYGSGVGTVVGAAYEFSMTAAAVVAALLIFAGNDFGRILGAGVAGAAMWEAAGWWSAILRPIASGEGVEVAHFLWLLAIPAALGGFVGIAALVMLAMPNISVYIAEKRKKAPAAGPSPAGASPMGAAPSGPPPGAQPPSHGQPAYGPPPGGQPPPSQGQSPYGPPQGQAPPPGGQPYGPPPGQGPSA